jgi:hypothetical protein
VIEPADEYAEITNEFSPYRVQVEPETAVQLAHQILGAAKKFIPDLPGEFLNGHAIPGKIGTRGPITARPYGPGSIFADAKDAIVLEYPQESGRRHGWTWLTRENALALADQIYRAAGQKREEGPFIVTREQPQLYASYRHQTLDSARTEAERLGRTVNPPSDFTVWQQVGRVNTYQPPREVSWVDEKVPQNQCVNRAGDPDEIPF